MRYVPRRAGQGGQHDIGDREHDQSEHHQHDPERLALVVRRLGPEVEEHDPDAIDGVKQHASDQAQLSGTKTPAEPPVVGAGEHTAVDVHREIDIRRGKPPPKTC